MRAFRYLLPPALTVLAAATAALHDGWLHDRIRPRFGVGMADGVGMAVEAAGWLALAWLTSRLLDLLAAGPGRAGQTRRIPRLLSDLARALIYALALLAILAYVLDQPVTGLLATSGVLIAVLGFALRNVIADIFSGIALNIERPYRIGDWIELAPGTAGQVNEINWRATRLITTDSTTIILPNSVVAGSRFVNHSLPGSSLRASIPVVLDQEVPVARAKRILLSALVGTDGILQEPRPEVIVDSMTLHGVTYQVRFWIPDYGRLVPCRDTVATAVLEHLARSGIELAQAVYANGEGSSPFRTRVSARAPGVLRRSLLRQLDLFAAFHDEEIEELAKAVRRHEVPSGTTIVRQGEHGSSLFVIAEGVFEVRTVLDGRPLLLDRLRSGDVFGEMSLLTGQPRSASVVTVTGALVYELDKAHLDPVLRRRPELAAQLAGLMAQRQSHNTAQRQSHAAADLSLEDAGPQDLLARLRSFFKL